MPNNASSYAVHSFGSTRNFFAANKYKSGAGFPCSTSSHVTTQSNKSNRPLCFKCIRTTSRHPLDATAIGTPFLFPCMMMVSVLCMISGAPISSANSPHRKVIRSKSSSVISSSVFPCSSLNSLKISFIGTPASS